MGYEDMKPAIERATWHAQLVIDNDYTMHNEARVMAENVLKDRDTRWDLGRALKDHFATDGPCSVLASADEAGWDGNDLAYALLTFALGLVDWESVADTYLDAAKETFECPDCDREDIECLAECQYEDVDEDDD